MTRLTRARPAAALAVVTMTACGESVVAPTAGSSGTISDDPEIKVAPTFVADIQPIMDRYGCASSSCHGIGQGNLFLTSDPEVNYRALVNVPANNEGSFLRVKPGDAENSYVIMVFENRQSPIFPRMPSEDGLDSVDLINFRNWIDQGAVLY